MKTVFQRGDRVFDAKYGHGLIIAVCKNEHNRYPITVRFNDPIGDITYTLGGRQSSVYLNPSLSFTEYDFINGGFSQDRKDIGTFFFNGSRYRVGSYEVVKSGIKIPETKKQFLIRVRVLPTGMFPEIEYYFVHAVNEEQAFELVRERYTSEQYKYSNIIVENCTL